MSYVDYEILTRAVGGIDVATLIDGVCKELDMDRELVVYAMWDLVEQDKLEYTTSAIVRTL